MAKSISVTHDHALLILNSEIASRVWMTPVRILEVGCGHGRMLAFLLEKLREDHPNLEFELHGFDVSDSNVQSPGFLPAAVKWLQEECPGVPWEDRILQLRSTDPWPYADETFDYVISNQVMEHVRHPEHTLAEVRRVLRDGGKSFHVFPLVHYWHEGHLLIPFAHWIRNHDLLRRYIRFASLLGLGKFREHRQADPEKFTLDFYAEEHADYLAFFTNYLSKRELLALTKAADLRCSFRYTEWLYINKLRLMLGMPVKRRVESSVSGFWQTVFVWFAMRVSSVTVCLEKKQTYFR